jgi:multiple sugar transport system permease protein/sn-glycerol 3-phosphate transport system permease protein
MASPSPVLALRQAEGGAPGMGASRPEALVLSPSTEEGRRARRFPPWTAPALYLAPMVVLLALFTYWPLIHTVWLSMVKWSLVPGRPSVFVGADNFAAVVASPLFEAAAWNTALYLVASIPLKVILPIPIAVFLWSLGPRGHVYRTVLFLPTLISFVVVSVVVLWLLNPMGGHVPTLLRMVGIAMGNPLTDAHAAIWVVIGLSAWKVMGFHVLIYLAGLASIPRDNIEAMRIDGASDWQVLRDLIWPLLAPTTLFVLISTIIFTLQQTFTPIDILTEGGPQNGTTNLFYLVYQLAMRSFDVGQGAAGTVMLFAGLLVLIWAKFRLLDRRVEYDR